MHVMLEKPMTLTARDAWALVHLARERGLHLQIGYTYQFTRHAQRAKEAVDAGELGEIVLVSGMFASMVEAYYRGLPDEYAELMGNPITMPLPETYSDPAISGGGQAMTQITHAMGMVHWVTGARTEEVFAYMANRDLAVDLIDAISYRFDGGALGTMSSAGTLKPHQVQPQELRYYGTEGYMLQEIWTGKLTIVRNDGLDRGARRPDEGRGVSGRRDVGGSGRSRARLAGNRAPAEAGAATVEFLELGYLSAREHRPVRRERARRPRDMAVKRDLDWTVVYEDADELRRAFGEYPDARYRPLVLTWWSGAPVTEEKLLWQVQAIADLGCGGLSVTGLAMHGAAADTAADDPLSLSEEWYRLYLLTCERTRELGMSVATWSPLMVGGPLDVPRLLDEHPEFRGEEVVTVGGVDVRPFGFDYGNPDAIAARIAPDAKSGEYLERVSHLLGDPIVALFEDEFPAFPRWSPTFASEFRAAKGYDFPLEAMDQDVGPRTPAHRVDSRRGRDRTGPGRLHEVPDRVHRQAQPARRLRPVQSSRHAAAYEPLSPRPVQDDGVGERARHRPHGRRTLPSVARRHLRRAARLVRGLPLARLGLDARRSDAADVRVGARRRDAASAGRDVLRRPCALVGVGAAEPRLESAACTALPGVRRDDGAARVVPLGGQARAGGRRPLSADDRLGRHRGDPPLGRGRAARRPVLHGSVRDALGRLGLGARAGRPAEPARGGVLRPDHGRRGARVDVRRADRDPELRLLVHRDGRAVDRRCRARARRRDRRAAAVLVGGARAARTRRFIALVERLCELATVVSSPAEVAGGAAAAARRRVKVAVASRRRPRSRASSPARERHGCAGWRGARPSSGTRRRERSRRSRRESTATICSSTATVRPRCSRCRRCAGRSGGDVLARARAARGLGVRVPAVGREPLGRPAPPGERRDAACRAAHLCVPRGRRSRVACCACDAGGRAAAGVRARFRAADVRPHRACAAARARARRGLAGGRLDLRPQGDADGRWRGAADRVLGTSRRRRPDADDAVRHQGLDRAGQDRSRA